MGQEEGLTKPRTPRISLDNGHTVGGSRAADRYGEVHKVFRMRARTMPYTANLHLRGLVYKRMLFRGRRKRHVRDVAPIILVRLRHDEGGPNRYKVRGSIVVIMMMMGYQ